jgi:xylulokinase
LFWSCDTPAYDREARLHSFCHAVPGKWHLMGVTLAAGGSLRWFRDALCEQGTGYDAITSMAETVEPGCEGLVFLPYLSGERTPYSDPKARGAFVGLSLRHTKAHMARAVMEGVALSLLDCMELAKEVGVETSRVYASGGGARSALWRSILAECFDAEIAQVGVDEGPAYGAAILASVGVRMFDSVETACRQLVSKTGPVVRPTAEGVAVYRKLYELYRPLYGALRDFYERAAEFVDTISG